MTDYQGVSLTEAYDNRSVMAQIARIKDRLTAVEQNVDPTLRMDLEAAVAELTALEETVYGIGTQVETNTGNITALQTDVGEIDTELAGKADTATVDAALALKANTSDVDADLELKADKTQLSDGSVTQVGTANVGSVRVPIYLNKGTPTMASGPSYGLGAGTCATIQATEGALINSDYASKPWQKIMSCPSITQDVKLSVTQWVYYYYESTTREQCAVGLAFISRLKQKAILQISDVDSVVVKAGSSPSDFEIFVKLSPATRGRQLCAASCAATNNDQVAIKTTGVNTGFTAYEDVEYGGIHIPNVSNYSQYTWEELTI